MSAEKRKPSSVSIPERAVVLSSFDLFADAFEVDEVHAGTGKFDVALKIAFTREFIVTIAHARLLQTRDREGLADFVRVARCNGAIALEIVARFTNDRQRCANRIRRFGGKDAFRCTEGACAELAFAAGLPYVTDFNRLTLIVQTNES